MKYIEVYNHVYIRKDKIISFKLHDTDGYGRKADRIVINLINGEEVEEIGHGTDIMEELLYGDE